MTISVDPATRVITVPQADLTPVSGILYSYDVDVLRLQLKDWEDSEAGMDMPDTHRHNTEVSLSGVTYARTFEVINGYTITFEDTGSPYTVRLEGANHNIADVTNYTSEVSLIIGNSAGLISTGGGTSDLTAPDGVEAGITLQQAMRVLLAVAAGKTVIIDLGAGLATVTFRNVNDDKDVVVANMTGSARTAVTLDTT